MTVGSTGKAYLTLPRLNLVWNTNLGSPTVMTLPRLQIIGAGNTTAVFVSLTLPRLTVVSVNDHAHGIVGYTLYPLKIPRLVESSSALHGIIGGTSNPLIIPRLTFSSFVHGATGKALLTLKALKIIGAIGSEGRVGSASLVLPLLKIYTTIYFNPTGSAYLTLPTLRLFSAGRESVLEKLGVPIRKGIAMNLVNWAVTEYTDYPFHSLVTFNGMQLGGKEDGIFDLDHGDGDDGKQIVAYLESGVEDLFKKFAARLREIWVESRQNGPLKLVICMGEKETSPVVELPIESVSNKMHEERIKTPRGLKERYASFRLENVDGSDVDLKRIKVFLEELPRRR